jgi:hypothetical protein
MRCMWPAHRGLAILIAVVTFGSLVLYIMHKAKAKADPLHAMKVLTGRGGTAPSHSWTLALDGGEWSASRPRRALAPGKGPAVPTGQEAGWTPDPVWT